MLKQHGGEGSKGLKKTAEKAKLPYHEGEGHDVKKKGNDGLLHPLKKGKDYCGPGRDLCKSGC